MVYDMNVDDLTNISKKKINRPTVIEIIFPFSIILSSYNLFGISLMYWLLGTSIVINFLRVKRKYFVYKPLLILLIFIVIHHSVWIIVAKEHNIIIFKNMIEAIMTTVIVIFASNLIRKDPLYKTYTFFAILSMIGLLYHSFQVYILGHMVMPIQILPNFLGDTAQWFNPINRPMSFFVEPEAYATFILPLIYWNLDKRKTFMASIFTLSIFLSTSTLGIFLSIVLWLIYISKGNHNWINKVVILIIITLLTFTLVQADVFQYAIDKIYSTDIINNPRISQGFKIWWQMPFLDKLLGVGEIPLADYIINQNMWLERMRYATTSNKWSYVTTISGALIYYGVIGAGLFYWTLYKMLKLNKPNKAFFVAVTIIGLSFGRTLLFNAWFVFWYIIYFIYIEKYDGKDYMIFK